MWALKTAYYRAFQKIMKIFMIFLDWSEPELLTGPGSIKKLPGVTGASVNFLQQKLTLEAPDEQFDEILKQAVKCCKAGEPDCTVKI